jgi:hypothetical protein
MSELSTLEIQPVSEAVHADVVRLWEACGLVVSYNPPLPSPACRGTIEL